MNSPPNPHQEAQFCVPTYHGHSEAITLEQEGSAGGWPAAPMMLPVSETWIH